MLVRGGGTFRARARANNDIDVELSAWARAKRVPGGPGAVAAPECSQNLTDAIEVFGISSRSVAFELPFSFHHLLFE